MRPPSLFTIVIPAYNQGRWLAGAIDSVLAQEQAPGQIIVIDDGSTDETSEILKAYSHQVTVIHQTNQGLSRARNRGAREAATRYIVYLDGDDRLFPWTLKVLGDVVLENRGAGIVLSQACTFEEDADLAGVSEAWPLVDRWNDYLETACTRYWIGVAGAIRRNVILDTGGFAGRAAGAEDHDFWLRAGTISGFCYVRSPPIYAHRQHPSSITRNPAKMYNGLSFILERERAGGYPGGERRCRERRLLIARLLHWGIKRCVHSGGVWTGYRLYIRGFKFLAAAGLEREALRLLISPVRGWVRVCGRIRRRPYNKITGAPAGSSGRPTEPRHREAQ